MWDSFERNSGDSGGKKQRKVDVRRSEYKSLISRSRERVREPRRMKQFYCARGISERLGNCKAKAGEFPQIEQLGKRETRAGSNSGNKKKGFFSLSPPPALWGSSEPISEAVRSSIWAKQNYEYCRITAVLYSTPKYPDRRIPSSYGQKGFWDEIVLRLLPLKPWSVSFAGIGISSVYCSNSIFRGIRGGSRTFLRESDNKLAR